MHMLVSQKWHELINIALLGNSGKKQHMSLSTQKCAQLCFVRCVTVGYGKWCQVILIHSGVNVYVIASLHS